MDKNWRSIQYFSRSAHILVLLKHRPTVKHLKKANFTAKTFATTNKPVFAKWSLHKPSTSSNLIWGEQNKLREKQHRQINSDCTFMSRQFCYSRKGVRQTNKRDGRSRALLSRKGLHTVSLCAILDIPLIFGRRNNIGACVGLRHTKFTGSHFLVSRIMYEY